MTAALIALALAAQPLGVAPASLVACAASRGEAAPVPIGAWVEYAPLRPGAARADRIRLFWTEAAFEGVRSRWLELWLDGTGRNALRLRPGDSALAPVALLKLNRTFLRLAVARPSRTSPCGGRAPEGRRQVISVPAGALSAVHQRVGRGLEAAEVWTSGAVPVTGLARLRFAAGGGWELAAAGEGAVSAFPSDVDALPLASLDAAAGGVLGALPQATR